MLFQIPLIKTDASCPLPIIQMQMRSGAFSFQVLLQACSIILRIIKLPHKHIHRLRILKTGRFEYLIGYLFINSTDPAFLQQEFLRQGGAERFVTGDMIILGKDEQGRGLIHICDYKNGKGVFVDAHENSQVMLYATGALNAYGYRPCRVCRPL